MTIEQQNNGRKYLASILRGYTGECDKCKAEILNKFVLVPAYVFNDDKLEAIAFFYYCVNCDSKNRK